jgi:hypothetical protein
MLPGFAGRPFSVIDFDPLLPLQFFATTERLPVINPGEAQTKTEVLPCPLLMISPGEAVQIYSLAFGTDAIE